MPTFVPLVVASHGSTPAGEIQIALQRAGTVGDLAEGLAVMIRIDAMWIATEPMDMRAGADRLLAAVVQVFGAAQAHHGTCSAMPEARIKLLVHDGFGVGAPHGRAHERRAAPDVRGHRRRGRGGLQAHLQVLQDTSAEPPTAKAPRQPRRQKLPEHLRRIEHRHELAPLNTRLRKTLGWRTPAEAFNELLRSASESSAPTTS